MDGSANTVGRVVGMTESTLLAILAGLGMGAGTILIVAGSRGWSPRIPRASRKLSKDQGLRRRLVVTCAVTSLVALVTRWPIAVLAAAVLTWSWPRLFGGSRHGRLQLDRLEALATWTESLRDTIAGAVGLEQAIVASADAAPDAIRPALLRLVGRARAHVPMPRALAEFADEFDDPSVDLVAAALILNARLRGPGLVGTLSALSASAREELEMRRAIEEGRRSLRRAAAIIVGVTVVFAGGLVLFSRQYVEPYGSPAGQLVLVVVILIFLVGFAWIRKAAVGREPERFLAGVDQLSRIGGVG